MCLRFFLSYDALKMGFYRLQNEYYFNTKHYVDMDVVNDVTSTRQSVTVKILKIGTPEIITIIVLQLEQLDFTVQYCVQKMQTE